MTPAPPIPPTDILQAQPEIPMPPEVLMAEEVETEEDQKIKINNICQNLVEDLTRAEQPYRELKLGILRRNELMWRGIQRILYDENAATYRSISEYSADELEELEILPEQMNGIINIVKAYGESIIGALAASIPKTRFNPKDAENPVDIIAARAASKVSDLIEKQNVSPILFLNALFTLFTEDYVAAYTFYQEAEEFGTYPEVVTKDERKQFDVQICPVCGYYLDDTAELDVVSGAKKCDVCGEIITPEFESYEYTDTVFDRIDHKTKGRIIIEIYGPSSVMIPLGCRSQKDTPYLILDTEVHKAFVKFFFEDISEGDLESSKASWANGSWARLPLEYGGDTVDTVPVRKVWVRPAAYSLIKEEEDRILFYNLFPKGCVITKINNESHTVAAAELDKHWTISKNPLSKFIHADPPINSIIPVQEMFTDLNDLTMETIRQAITETFADPNTIDFANYTKIEARPGQVLPAQPRPGMGLDSSFFQVKNATLSQEVKFYMDFLQQIGQFILGAFPSIYGGPQEGGKTAREYELSRAQALQRLSIIWKVLSNWWPVVMTKAVKLFKDYLKWDESFSKPAADGGFTKVWIRQQELMGEIADVEPETSEQFPTTFAEQRDQIMNLIGFQNDKINEAVFSLDNIELLQKVSGIPDLKLPGAADRQKQLIEIAEMLKSPPNPDGSPTIPVEKLIDDNDICLQTIRTWLVSVDGLDAKESNPEGYANVFAQYQARIFLKEQQMMEEEQRMMMTGQTPPDSDMSVELGDKK